MIAHVERMDVMGVVRHLRPHPSTRHLSQTALARMVGVSQSTISGWETGRRRQDVRHAAEALHRLGAPGVRWGRRWLLPEDLTAGTEPELHPATVAEDASPRVVITVPMPIDVQVIDPHQAHTTGYVGAVAFVTDQNGPRLIVTADTTWGMNSAPDGATAWFALNPLGQPATRPLRSPTDAP